jgi:hypothetical protein
VVPGMKHDESHAFQHALLNSVDQGVTDLVMGNMPPPEEVTRDTGELQQHNPATTPGSSFFNRVMEGNSRKVLELWRP